MHPHGKSRPQPLLTLTRQEHDGTRVLALSGDLDHDSAGVLRQALADSLAGGHSRVLVDLAEVGFCDSTGVNVLLRARQQAQADGTSLELCALGAQAARLFDMTGAATVFTIHPAQRDALGPGG